MVELRTRPFALIAAVALALALPACGALPGTGDDAATQETSGFAGSVDEIVSDISSIDCERVDVRDAGTGELLATVTDPAAIDAAFSGVAVDQQQPIGSADGLEPACKLELWRPETVKLGESAADADEVLAATVTLYDGTDDVFTVELGDDDIGITLRGDGPQTVEAMRSLVP